MKWRSSNSIVIAAANTGKESTSKKLVIRILHTNNFNLKKVINRGRILTIVTIKLILPITLLAPARCRLKSIESTARPGCPILLLRGG